MRYSLSLRNVKGLRFERGIYSSHEAVRMRRSRFGSMFARTFAVGTSAACGFKQWSWHLDQVPVKPNGVPLRTFDQEGEILESYITTTREKAVDLTFIKKALTRHGSHDAIITDGLRSYRAAVKELDNAEKQTAGRWANNRVANSHLPFRRPKRAMLRYRVMKSLRKFASVHGSIHNYFNQNRQLADRQT